MFAHRCNSHCYASGGRSCDNSGRVYYAKSICEGCPVLAHCRMWALESRLEGGVAGAMTEAERLAFHERYDRMPHRRIGHLRLPRRVTQEAG